MSAWNAQGGDNRRRTHIRRVITETSPESDPSTRLHAQAAIILDLLVVGTHLAAANEIPAAQLWVSTAQLYVLGRQGKEQLSTEGVEGSGTVTRIVTGGAGNFAGWVGEQRQTFLGFNATGGVNLRVTFILRPPAS